MSEIVAEQCDKDAAIAYLNEIAGLRGGDAITGIRDNHPAVVHMARHRLAALQSACPAASEGEARSFCNKCGFFGVADQDGFHRRPEDGQMCNYTARAARQNHSPDAGGIIALDAARAQERAEIVAWLGGHHFADAIATSQHKEADHD